MVGKRKRSAVQDQPHSDRFRLTALALFALLVLWAPFPEGIYPSSRQIIAFWNAGLFLSVVLVLGAIERRALTVTPARVAGAALWLAYALAMVVAVVPREALQETIKMGLFFAVFLAVSELTRSSELARAGGGPPVGASPERRGRPRTAPDLAAGAALALWASGAVLALASLLSAVGVLPFSEVVHNGRLYTFLGYPNPAGSVAGAAFLLGVGLRRLWRGRLAGLVEFVLPAGQWALLAMLFLSASRGAWLVFPVAVMAVIAVWPRGERFSAVGELILTGLAAVVSVPFIPGVYGNLGSGSLLVLAGIGAGLAAGRLARLYQARAPRRQALLAGVAVLVLLAGAGALLVTGSVPKLLLSRLTSFDLGEKSAVERIIWTQDAFKIVKDYPVLGAGGGAWASLYFQYQEYPYATREVHNDYLTTWVETGTVGFAALVALMIASAGAALRLTRRETGRLDPGRRALAAGVASAALMIALHSALDFNLALAYSGVLLWSLLGLLDGFHAAGSSPAPERGLPPASRPAAPRLWPRVAIVAIIVSLAVVSMSLFGAVAVAGKAERLPSHELVAAEAHLRRAADLDPWAKSPRVNLALVLEALYGSTGRDDYLIQAFAQADQAVALDRFSPSTRAFRGGLAQRHGDLDRALQEYEEALKLHPCEARRYESAAEVRLDRAREAFYRDARAVAQAELENLLALGDRLAEKAAAVPAHAPADTPIPPMTPVLSLRMGQALLLLGREAEARPLLEAALTARPLKAAGETLTGVPARKAEAALWLAAAARLDGAGAAAADYLALAGSVYPDPRAALDELLALLARR